MEVATRPYVLDCGAEAKRHCKTTGKLSLHSGISIAYQVYELCPQQDVQVGAGVEAATTSSNSDKVLMIMGFAAGSDAWLPTLRELFCRGDKVAGVEAAIFDNRGIGRSCCPEDKKQYTTDIMAQDALALMDHLGWRKAHVVGHSMGAMISIRLALAAPDRVASLAAISVSGGGFEAIPLNPRAMWAALRTMSSSSDPCKRARADLAFHFSPKLLKLPDPVSGRRVKDVLSDEYVATSKAIGRQTKAGEEGQLNAVMKHGTTPSERRRLAAAGFPIKVIHGVDDILAVPRHAAHLARELRAPLVLLDGAHFIPRDCAPQIVDELLSSIEAVRHGASHADAVHASYETAAFSRGCLCCCA